MLFLKKLTKIFVLCLSVYSAGPVYAQKQPVDYVDLFIGTSNSRWMMGPYAQEPFGMVQLGPQNQGNVWQGGYEYAINSISGFSHIHAWTMGGLLMMPTTTDLSLNYGTSDSPYKGANAAYHSRITKCKEKAFPGYYSAYLFDHEVTAEMTATHRCGFQRYTFPECAESRILVDLQFPTEWDYGFKVFDANITKVSNTEIEGYAKCQSGAWGSWNDYTLFFVLKFSKPFQVMNAWNRELKKNDVTGISGKDNIGIYVTYTTHEDEQIMVQSGISLVGIEGARQNLDAELSLFNWDFDTCVAKVRADWNELLGHIKVEGTDEAYLTRFYTNLYRSFTGKQTWNDVDGKYVDACENIRQLKSGQNIYGGDAFWNTFWNLNGLWSIMSPVYIDNWVTSQLEMFKNTGFTGKGPTGIEYSGIMEGSHEIALMVAAYQKGIRKDGDHIYAAVHKTVTESGGNHNCGGTYGQINLKYYDKYEYMPSEVDVVSKTLDYAYDDWCVAQLAKELHKKDDFRFLQQRSMNYKNVFHPKLKYVVCRDSTGNWDPEFDVFSNKGFIEGNSWQYSWYVPHDIPGLIKLIGVDTFNLRLEEGFEKSRDQKFAAHAFDRTMGQSARYYINQGNEVNMCTPYLFNYSGKPWLCQKYVREVLNVFYGSTPFEGWEGDEDEGQLSSWFVMSSIGFFEMDGGCSANPRFTLGSPVFDKITIKLDNKYYPGKEFIIQTTNNSGENCYIQSARLNGKELRRPFISFNDIVNGGKLELIMGDTPNMHVFK